MSYHLRSRGAPPVQPPLEDDDDDENMDESSDSTYGVEGDAFYAPYLGDEMLMNIARIVRYETDRALMNANLVEDEESDEASDDDEAEQVETRVVPASEEIPPVVVDPLPAIEQPDPTLLGPDDFLGIPRYRLAFMCVRYFEWTGIRNIEIASSISNEALMRALCHIPRGRVVQDCSICSFPLWDVSETACCKQQLCIHCVYRCKECPFCRTP